jgi:DoxX-like family
MARYTDYLAGNPENSINPPYFHRYMTAPGSKLADWCCKLMTVCIALVWAINGLWCKLANMVPRHRAIVARILGESYAMEITTTIGFLELGMAIWILSSYKPRLNAWVQAILVAGMNLLEFWLARDLLLFGGFNLLFALGFVMVVLVHAWLCKAPAMNRKYAG